MAEPMLLGEATFPSGVAVVLDMGLMWLWSHDRPPVMPAGRYGPETEAAANSSADFAIEGPDAEVAGLAFDRQPDPLRLCDIPRAHWASFRKRFNAFVRERGFDARLVRLPERVSHRERVARAAA
ncbi:MAG: hypothetical protein K2W96_24655, partial [Gemmataceae bacterium]|nr:hypothetical protein [Gemmataceae bacterium]